jgi:glutamyl-Q tRNA(Asp) synthetase
VLNNIDLHLLPLIKNTPSVLGYRGRFAPSPTGVLHFGSLIAAVGSYLEAKSHGGEWLVRIEDLDKPREVPAASYKILRSLEALGMEWDHEVTYQDQRKDIYEDVLTMLNRRGLIYPCTCTRKEISSSSIAGISGQIYAGTCRNNVQNDDRLGAVRIKTNSNIIEFEDTLYGLINQNLQNETGDFVLRRSDKIYAYQLAVVVDDSEQGITNVVRGADLLDSTPRQIYLQKLLGYTTPTYMHLPVAVNSHGEKLSKQTKAAHLDVSNPVKQLIGAVNFLGQEPPTELLRENVMSFWKWAFINWDPGKIPKKRTIQFQLDKD